jgi:hypothetical protein
MLYLLGKPTRHQDDIPVGQADSRLDDIPASGAETRRHDEDTVGQDPCGLDNIPISAGEDANRSQASGDNIVDDLIESDLRIKERAGETSKLGLGIFETATFADICLAQGKFEKALEIYTKLLMIHPDNPEYREKINSIQAKMGSR